MKARCRFPARARPGALLGLAPAAFALGTGAAGAQSVSGTIAYQAKTGAIVVTPRYAYLDGRAAGGPRIQLEFDAPLAKKVTRAR